MTMGRALRGSENELLPLPLRLCPLRGKTKRDRQVPGVSCSSEQLSPSHTARSLTFEAGGEARQAPQTPLVLAG